MRHERGSGVSTATGDLAYARMSRRQFVYRSAVTVGGLAGLELLRPSLGFSASGSDPTPIPGGIKFVGNDIAFVPADPDIHVLPPALGLDVSTITDFSGFVAAAEIQGGATGGGGSFGFDADMRVIQGKYVGEDGRVHEGSFGFI
jgi:hypothetical protein